MKRALSIVLFSTCRMFPTAQVSFRANAPRDDDNVERNAISLISPGQYIVYIKTAGEIHTEKFNHK